MLKTETATDSPAVEQLAGTFVSGVDVVESTLAAVLESRLASCAVAHLLSEATSCAEAVKAAFEKLRSVSVDGE